MSGSSHRIGLTTVVCVSSVAMCAVAVAEESSEEAVRRNNSGVTAAQAGRWDEAAFHLRQALQLAPGDTQIQRSLSAVLTDWAVEYVRTGDVEEALALLEEATRWHAGNGYAWLHLGDVHYLERHDFGAAIEAWRRARGALSDEHRAALESRLTRVERDHALERGLPTHTTDHFHLRVQGEGGEPLARQAGQMLEQAYAQLAQALEIQPPRLSVIIYTDRAFARVSPSDWALGFYDGRIRIRGEELSHPYAAALLTHEVAHAFLQHAYGARLPTWVHEGFAQAQEPPRDISAAEAAVRAGVARRTHWVPLQWLDRRFRQPAAPEDVWRAYAQAREVMTYLLERHGVVKCRQWLTRLGHGEPVDRAFEAVYAPLRWTRVEQGRFE